MSTSLGTFTGHGGRGVVVLVGGSIGACHTRRAAQATTNRMHVQIWREWGDRARPET